MFSGHSRGSQLSAYKTAPHVPSSLAQSGLMRSPRATILWREWFFWEPLLPGSPHAVSVAPTHRYLGHG